MDQLPALFAQSLAMLQREGNTLVGFQIGSLVYDSRNNLAKKAIQAEADYVMWFDSDMTFQPDTLQRMVRKCEEEKLDFLSGVYFRRVPPYRTVLFDRLEIIEGKGCRWTSFESVPDGTFEIAGCGFGCVLVRTEVIMSVAAKFGGRMFDPLEGLGEDLSFCWRARQCGYKLYCDSTVECGHVGNVTITRAYHDAMREVKNDVGENKTGDEDLDDSL